jgi:hypothetical protein
MKDSGNTLRHAEELSVQGGAMAYRKAGPAASPTGRLQRDLCGDGQARPQATADASRAASVDRAGECYAPPRPPSASAEMN